MTQAMVFTIAGALSLAGFGLLFGLAMNVKGFGLSAMSSCLLKFGFFLSLALLLLTRDLHEVSIIMIGFFIGVFLGVLGSLNQRPQRPGDKFVEVPPADMRPGYRPGCKVNFQV